jgi:tRNA A-37 threonylcarbamoyl transferase component Bud32
MDAGPSAHPTVATLQAYGLGKLDDASAGIVREHLETCLECQRQGADITASNSEAAVSPTTGATAADDAIVDSSSSPAMSSTGQAGLASDASNSSDEISLQPDTRVGYFGDYELLNVLGEGGMGTVYKARQFSLNRLVALKMIKASRFPSADEVRRFHNEAEAVARLDHSNIVPIFEIGRYEDQNYFSMKLIAGESLDKKLKDYIADPQLAAKLMTETATAIHHAHQRGILHRDLKPANILVDSEGQPHVSDFGLAKRIDGDSELTRSGAILGTPAYMAPEQASAKRGAVTTATDVYGLGAVFYAQLTGEPPFDGDSVVDTLQQVRERPPERLRNRNPRVPRGLEVICLKCLDKDPRRRYGSAEQLAQDLNRWLAGEPIAARPSSVVGRAIKRLQRHRIVSILCFAIAAVTVLGLAGMAWQSGLARKHQAELERERVEKLHREAELERAQELVRSLERAVAEREAALRHAESVHKTLLTLAKENEITIARMLSRESMKVARQAEIQIAGGLKPNPFQNSAKNHQNELAKTESDDRLYWLANSRRGQSRREVIDAARMVGKTRSELEQEKARWAEAVRFVDSILKSKDSRGGRE